MRLVKNVLATLSTFVLLSGQASAALIASTGPIASLRIEGTAGFIGLSQTMSSSSTCNARVWVDMTTPLGRSIYATAMMAFSTGRTVTIRAAEESQRMFGECSLYDLYVTQ